MKQTIKSSQRISRLFNSGERFTTKTVLALFCATPASQAKCDQAEAAGCTGQSVAPPAIAARLQTEQQLSTPSAGRIAFVAGKKLGSAPARNLAKRRLRAAAAAQGAPWSGYDVVLVARTATANADFAKLEADLSRLADRLTRLSADGRQQPPKEPRSATTAARSRIPRKARIRDFILRLPRNLVLVCIKIYRHAISPIFPPTCRFVPTCSEYALIAFERFGFIKGFWLTVKRVGRCHPLSPGGWDPVPEQVDKGADKAVTKEIWHQSDIAAINMR